MPSVPATAPKASAYDSHINREASSRAYEARQAPAFKASVGDRTYTPQQVQQARTTYYTTVYRDRYIPAPTGASYGSFSESFMWAMMWNSVFAHNHSNDPDYQRWRRDAEERARTDQRIKDQLDELDRKVGELKNTPKDPNYVPKDVPPEVVFNEAALTKKAAPIGHSIWFWLVVSIAALVLALIIFPMFFSRMRHA